MPDKEKNWTNFHLNKAKGNYPIWPIESMVKILFGDYLAGTKPKLDENTKVLDVGCGFGNNLLPFLVRGCKCHGSEISDEVCDLTRDTMAQRGFDNVTIKTGHNRSIPFDDNEFDLLLSNGVLHYESSKTNYLNALEEYRRVLKPGGGLYLMTTGPNHDIYQKASPLGSHQFMIQDFDFRDGERFFFVSDKKYLKYFLEKYFVDIELGREMQVLMTYTYDAFIAYCRKPL